MMRPDHRSIVPSRRFGVPVAVEAAALLLVLGTVSSPVLAQNNLPEDGPSASVLEENGEFFETDDFGYIECGGFSDRTSICLMGDFTGDGLADLAELPYYDGLDGQAYVRRNTGSFFESRTRWSDDLCDLPGQDFRCVVGDVDGDGRDDLVQFRNGSSPAGRGVVTVARSNGFGFGEPAEYSSNLCYFNTDRCALADVNGDGRDDVVVASLWGTSVALSTGSSFDTLTGSGLPAGYACPRPSICLFGDVDGDGAEDLVRFAKGDSPAGASGDVLVALSQGFGFEDFDKRLEGFCLNGQQCLLADLDGDGRDDLVAIDGDALDEGQPGIHAALSTDDGFGRSSLRALKQPCGCNQSFYTEQMNNDDKEDIVVINTSPFDGYNIFFSQVPGT